MRIFVCDTEVFKHDWLFCAKDITDGTEYCFWNDLEAFTDFYNRHTNDLFVGYNIRGYDQYIIKAILCGMNPKAVNDWIIKQRNPGWAYSDAFRKVPLNFYDVMVNRNMGSLKTLMGFMGMDIEESQVDFDIDRSLTHEEREMTIHYCKHDVEATCKVFELTINEFNSHVAILKEFKRPMRDMCKTQAQLAAKVLGAVPKTHDDELDIRLPETLVLDKYREVLDWFLTPVTDIRLEMTDVIKGLKEEAAKYGNRKKGEDIRKKIREMGSPDNPDDFKRYYYTRFFHIDIAGVPSDFAWGGLHGALPKFNYVCESDEVLLMADVDQLYPTLMVMYKLLSRGVTEPQRFENILATSLRLKAEKKKKEREPYKRICNITYGAEGDKHNSMYDPLHRNLVCVFGQVLLLDLIEKVEGICKPIQYNTDGILVLIKRKDINQFKAIVHEWEERTHLHMSYDEFVKVYQPDVNNYVIIDKDGNFKSKGAYVKQLGTLDYDLPIVNEAITNYLINGTHPRTTVMECEDFIKFQRLVKVSTKYERAYKDCTFRVEKVDGNPKRIWNEDGMKLGYKTMRVFASINPDDGGIFKYRDGENPAKFENTPENCFIWNKLINAKKVPTFLDRNWYIDMALTRLSEKFDIQVADI